MEVPRGRATARPKRSPLRAQRGEAPRWTVLLRRRAYRIPGWRTWGSFISALIRFDLYPASGGQADAGVGQGPRVGIARRAPRVRLAERGDLRRRGGALRLRAERGDAEAQSRGGVGAVLPGAVAGLPSRRDGERRAARGAEGERT